MEITLRPGQIGGGGDFSVIDTKTAGYLHLLCTQVYYTTHFLCVNYFIKQEYHSDNASSSAMLIVCWYKRSVIKMKRGTNVDMALPIGGYSIMPF